MVDNAVNGAELQLSADYTLLDSLANLSAADAAVVEGASSYTLTEATAANLVDVKVADLAAAQSAAVDAVRDNDIVKGATNGDTITVNNGSYTLLDSLANLSAADAAVVEGASSYTLTEATAANLVDVKVADLAAAQSAAVDAVRDNDIVKGATNGDTITVNNGSYTLLDSGENLVKSDASVLAGAEGVTVTGTIEFDQADAIAAAATAPVTATVVRDENSAASTDRADAFVLDLLALEAGNAWTFEVTAARTAEELLALDAITTVAVGATGVTSITGSAEDLIAVMTSKTIALPNVYDVNVTGATIAQVEQLDNLNGTGKLTYSLADTAANLANDAGGYVGDAAAVTIKGDATAAQLATIYGVNSAVTVKSIVDTASNIEAIKADSTGRIAADHPSITIDGEVSAADANVLLGLTDGVVTATVEAAIADTLVGALGKDRAEDKLTLTVKAGEVTAEDLNTLDGRTALTVDASAVTKVSGTAAQLETLLDGDVSLPANYDVTVTDAPTLAELAAIDAANGSGALVYTAVSGTIEDLLASPYVTGAVAVVVTDDATVAEIFDLDQMTTGKLTYSLADSAANLANNAGKYVAAAGAVTIVGDATADQLATIHGLKPAVTVESIVDTASNILKLNNAIRTKIEADDPAITIVGELSLVQFLSVRSLLKLTDGVVTATLTKATASTLVTTLGDASETDKLTLTVSAGAVTAAQLNTLDGRTALTVDASAVTKVSGTAAQLETLRAGDVSLPANYDVTVTDAPTLAELAAIDAANGSGALVYTAVSGPIADLLASSYVTGAVDVVVTGDATVAEIFDLDQMTTGELTYSLADSAANLANNAWRYVARAGAVTIVGNATADQLDTIYGVNSAVTVASIVDTASNIEAIKADGTGRIAADHPSITIDGEVSAADANVLLGLTDGVVTATVKEAAAKDLAGKDLEHASATDKLTLTVKAGEATAADLNTLDGRTALTVNASAVTKVSGTAAELATLRAGDVTLPAKYDVTVEEAPTLAELAAIDAANGSGALVYTAVADTAENLAANVDGYIVGKTNVTFTTAATLAQIGAVDAANAAGKLDYQEGIEDTYANLVGNAGGYVNGSVAVTVTDESITVAQANALDILTTATISDTDPAELLKLNGSENQYSVGVAYADLLHHANGNATTAATNLNTIGAKTASLTVVGSAFSDDIDLTGVTVDVTVVGASRNDKITGGAGNDALYGDDGADTLFGGEGADTFVYTTGPDSVVTSFDTLMDFKSGIDFIQTGADVTSLNQGGSYTADGSGDLADLITAAVGAGNTAAKHAAAVNDAYVVEITGTSPETYVFQDTDGDASVDDDELVILLGGTSDTTLTASDFVA